jgi:hypothetical protein
MVLRKPLAFLIKHFKLIHFFLVLINVFLIYKTSEVLVFFNEYITSSSSLVGTTLASKMIPSSVFLAIFVMMIGSGVILTILKLKEKPIKFYAFNILVYAIVLAIFLYDYTVLEQLENTLIEIKILELARDLLAVSIIFQNISLVWLGIRAVGFDIKSFHFNENLDELEIKEEDNEEFEVDLEVDKHLYTRYFRKFKRFATYMIKENKLLVTMFVLIVIALSCYIIYLNHGVYEDVLQTNQAFQTTEFIINVENSYYTETDYRNAILKENTGFVVLRIDAKKLSSIKKSLNTGRFTLRIGSKIYKHTSDYKEKLADLGFSYTSENITTEFSSYLLVFEIPSSMKNESMILRYDDTNGKDINIDVTPLDLTKERKGTTISLTGEMNFKDSPLKETILEIQEYDIQDQFKITYNYCFDSDNCYESYEYVKTSTGDKSTKILLKLVGTISIDEDISIEPLSSIHKFMRYFGTIQYTVNDETKTVSGDFKRILPVKTENKNEYYIEVPSDMKKATSIQIVFNIRNYIYTYKLK